VRGFGEFVQSFERCGALRVFQDRGDSRNARQAVDLMAGEFDDRHGSKGTHGAAVLRDELMYGGVAGSTADAGFAAGEDNGRGQALDVPLEGAADGFVEVVDVEDEAAVRACVGAEVEDMGVSAELGEQAGVGLAGEIGGHDGHGPSIEAKGRGRHARVLDGKQRLDAGALNGEEEIERIGRAGSDVESSVGLAGDLMPSMQAEGSAFVVSGRSGQKNGLGHRVGDRNLCNGGD